MIKELIANLPQLLGAAAQSQSGILGLMIIALSIVGILLFRKSNDYIKFAIYLILFSGVVSYGWAIKDDKNYTPTVKEIEQTTINAKTASRNEQIEKTEYVGWIFLGTYKGNSWELPRFKNPEGIPKGDIVLTEERPLMSKFPQRVSWYSTQYDFGERITSIPVGATVKIIETGEVGRSRIYAKVKYVD